MKKSTKLRNLLKKRDIIVAPGVCDVFSAKIVERCGFESIYMSGFVTTATVLGMPDLGLTTMSEMVRRLNNLDNATSLPIIADGESGFGNALNMQRTIVEYEKAGASALHIEDHMASKKYYPDGKPQVVPLDEHLGKLRAAIDARTDPDLVIIGRTDALLRYGIDEAIDRAKAMEEVGVDMVFVHDAWRSEHLKSIAKAISIPHIVNYATFIIDGDKELPSVSELSDLGQKVLILPLALFLGAAQTQMNLLTELKNKGTLEGVRESLLSKNDLVELLEMKKYQELEERYLPKAPAGIGGVC